jgi:hypothetical protein
MAGASAVLGVLGKHFAYKTAVDTAFFPGLRAPLVPAKPGLRVGVARRRLRLST